MESMGRINSVVELETVFCVAAPATSTYLGGRVTTNFAVTKAETISKEDEEMMSSMEETMLTLSTFPSATTKSLISNQLKAIKLFLNAIHILNIRTQWISTMTRSQRSSQHIDPGNDSQRIDCFSARIVLTSARQRIMQT